MPWYNYRRQRYRRPWRRFWKRSRRPIRRRWRYRPYWVRKTFKKKLKKITLSQWQPKTIHKTRIKGFLCLFECNAYRIGHNYEMYENSWVPEHLPGGGGFSIKNISLNTLYDEHKHVNNYWTKGNDNLPLVKYHGLTVKLYPSEDVDYCFGYKNCGALTSSQLQYNGLQPSVFMMNKYSIKVPSKKTKRLRRGYKKIKISPPAMMRNQWYFMADICNIPLVQFQTVACSFDHYYIATNSMSTNVSIHTLNTTLLQNRDFKNYTTGYYARTEGTRKVYLYASQIENQNEITPEDIVYLGNTKLREPGVDKKNSHASDYDLTNPKWWGNPFHPDYITNHVQVYQSFDSPTQIKTKTKPLELTKVNITRTLRYNPKKDPGKAQDILNKSYFLTNEGTGHGWDPPSKEELINEGFPLYILLFGFEDWQKKLGTIHHIDTSYMLVLNTHTTTPTQDFIVPLDDSFIHGNSPFEENFNPLDYDRWYPSTQYQQQSINDILSCGPGTPKIIPKNSVEAKCEYIFHLKFGGCPAPMSIVENPADQPKFPVPNNMYENTSLQSPALPISEFLYNFDERKGLLTKTATKRITKDQSLEQYLFTDGTAESPFSAPPGQKETPETDSEEEKEETSLIELLNLQYNKQQRLRQRILKTLHHLQKLE
nr:MAG: ORF1 [TTV-like mini virus]